MKAIPGQLLVASPKLGDPNFYRTVVLMVQHGDEGALGLVLNRPLEVTVQSAWEQVSEVPCEVEGPLFQGGPCEGPLMVVHTREDLGQLSIGAGLHFSTEKDSVEQLVSSNREPMKFFVGYAGWGPGQLERELEEGGWLTAPATPEQVFGDGEGLWQGVIRAISKASAPPWLDPRLIPDDPSVN